PSGTIVLSSTIAGDTLGNCVLSASATAGVSTCTASVTPMSVGTRTISESFVGGTVRAGSGPLTARLTAKYGITLSLTSAPNPSVPIQSITVQFTSSNSAPVAPTGSVTVADGEGNSCTAPIAASGSCSLTATSTGTKTLTASYAGDANFFSAQA